MSGINFLFAASAFWPAASSLSIACLYRNDERPGFYPLLAVLLLALPALPRASTSLEFFFIWELITLSSYFLILRGRKPARMHCAICCFRLSLHFSCSPASRSPHAVTGSASLAALRTAGHGYAWSSSCSRSAF